MRRGESRWGASRHVQARQASRGVSRCVRVRRVMSWQACYGRLDEVGYEMLGHGRHEESRFGWDGYGKAEQAWCVKNGSDGLGS